VWGEGGISMHRGSIRNGELAVLQVLRISLQKTGMECGIMARHWYLQPCSVSLLLLLLLQLLATG